MYIIICLENKKKIYPHKILLEIMSEFIEVIGDRVNV